MGALRGEIGANRARRGRKTSNKKFDKGASPAARVMPTLLAAASWRKMDARLDAKSWECCPHNQATTENERTALCTDVMRVCEVSVRACG